MFASCDVLAYIGPGAGFAVSFSVLTFLAVVLGVFFVVIVSPFWLVLLRIRGRRRRYPHVFRKVVILGLDGLDPGVIRRLMFEGKAPNFSSLAIKGHFSPLQTTTPALSPTAWSSFMTGNDVSYHNIYDFVTRDLRTCGPRLSSCELIDSHKRLPIGRYRIPLSRSHLRMLRKGVPFWHMLGEHGLEVTVLRVPITFPPQPFKGRLLSGMCVPDLAGSQGTYSYYATGDQTDKTISGRFLPLHFHHDVARTKIIGPRHPFLSEEKHLTLPLEIRRCKHTNGVRLVVGRQRFDLTSGRSSRWIRLAFRAGVVTIHGMVQFHLLSAEPEVELYMTPVQIDPEKAAMRIGHPRFFPNFLAKRIGPFGTLGLMEDTSALNDGVLSEYGFLSQAWSLYDERKGMFLKTLERGFDDVTVCVFDTPDRIQHMFWRYREQDHPAQRGGDGDGYTDAIERMYRQMDALVGETMQRLSWDTLFLVISDHGFTSFRRGVNLNAWLHRNGYLHLLPDADMGGKWLDGVDWTRTRAYALGLTGIFINLKGRESKGIVQFGDEFEDLLTELQRRLEDLRDPQTSGDDQVIRHVYIARRHFQGPFRSDGPDLIIGYEPPYRCSWDGANGQVTKTVFSDNTRPWSGDHCVDAEAVPGVLFANFPFHKSAPSITDIAPTVLDVFDIRPQSVMQGVSLWSGRKLRH